MPRMPRIGGAYPWASAKKPNFVVFNGKNRNILHVLMVKIRKLCKPGGGKGPPLPPRQTPIDVGRPCARTVAKNKKYQDVGSAENRTRARYPLHHGSTKQKVSKCWQRRESNTAACLRGERATHYTTSLHGKRTYWEMQHMTTVKQKKKKNVQRAHGQSRGTDKTDGHDQTLLSPDFWIIWD